IGGSDHANSTEQESNTEADQQQLSVVKSPLSSAVKENDSATVDSAGDIIMTSIATLATSTLAATTTVAKITLPSSSNTPLADGHDVTVNSTESGDQKTVSCGTRSGCAMVTDSVQPPFNSLLNGDNTRAELLPALETSVAAAQTSKRDDASQD